MTKHRIKADQEWFDSRYAGVDFAGISHDGTYLMNREDAQALIHFLNNWLIE